ncbi:hypothetical protein FOZ62_031156, partial [Perkinsus olseni]
MLSVSPIALGLVLCTVIQQVVSSARRPWCPLAAGYYISCEEVDFLGKSIRVKVHIRALEPRDDNRALMHVTIGGDGREIEMPRYAEVKRYNALSTDRFFISGEIGGSNNVFQRDCFTVEHGKWLKAYFVEVAQGLGIPPAAWVRPGFRLCPFGDSWVFSLGRAGAYNLTYPVELDLNEHALVDSSAPEAGFNSGDLTKEKVDALVFAPPPLALRRIDDLCYHLDATDRRDRNEIAKAFNDAGGAFEISNFMPASTIMCWWQDRAAGDLWLGMRIDQQGVAFR